MPAGNAGGYGFLRRERTLGSRQRLSGLQVEAGEKVQAPDELLSLGRFSPHHGSERQRSGGRERRTLW